MLGSMASLPIPGLHTDAEAVALHDDLIDRERIEVPIPTWPVRGGRVHPDDPPRAVLVRVSVQRYVEPEDIERLATVLAGRLTAA